MGLHGLDGLDLLGVGLLHLLELLHVHLLEVIYSKEVACNADSALLTTALTVVSTVVMQLLVICRNIKTGNVYHQ